MRVLMLSRYVRLGASSRVRFYQYLPWLEAAGLDVVHAPLFSNEYVMGLQRGSKSPVEALRAYARRVKVLAAARDFDLLWIEKETLPWLPAWLEKLLLPRAVPYVLDYDDAVFHQYDKHRSRVVRAMLAEKHPTLMRGAKLVVVGNEYLAEYARAAGAPKVAIVPTVIDLWRYSTGLMEKKTSALPCIGWIGQRATASFLAPYAELFKRLASTGLARFAAIGIDPKALGLPMEKVAWSESGESTAVASFDIGIMPLVDGFFERGKCGYKLIQYMASGLPVVASPVGVNQKIVEHGVNGFLANTQNEWEDALRTLLADADLRQRMGSAGREKIEREYCTEITGPILSALLIQAAERN